MGLLHPIVANCQFHGYSMWSYCIYKACVTWEPVFLLFYPNGVMKTENLLKLDIPGELNTAEIYTRPL